MQRCVITLLNHLRCVCHRMQILFRVHSRTCWTWVTTRHHLLNKASQTAHVSCIVTRSFFRFLTYSVDLETIFAPKQLLVSNYWLSVIIWCNNQHINVVKLSCTRGKSPIPLDEAVVKLEQEWANVRSDFPQEIIPVFCLHNINPFVEGVRALLLPNLPKVIERQIAALRLRNPINLRTHVGPKNSGMLGKTVVDFDTDRFVVIGNAQWFCKTLATLGKRLTIPCDRTRTVSQIKDMMCKHNISPVGSSLLIGGLGTVFAFEVAFLVTRIQGIDTNNSSGLLIVCVLSLLGILAFLVQEASESHIVAFCPWWAVKSKIVSWFIFLGALIVSPICFFVPVNSRLLCEATRWTGLLLMTSCAITNIGQIFFQSGLSKRFTLIWWLFLIFSVALLPLLD